MSLPTTARSWILSNKPTAHLPTTTGPKPTFTLETRELPAVKDGQVLVKPLYLSNDPAQRGWISASIDPDRLYTAPVNTGDAMRARGLAEVLESKDAGFQKGDIVQGTVDWNEYVVLDVKEAGVRKVAPLPGGLSLTHYLGALGGTGLTAYYGLVVVCGLQKGEKVVVSGAAGATGSMVVQIAKNIVGASNVIGIAGNDEKCKWVESLGADKCLNYKSASFADELKAATKEGVDVYFDNVGGEILDLMLGNMSQYGRIAACGAVSGYNSDNSVVLKNYFNIISMRLQVKGFIVTDYLPKAAEAIGIFRQALADGKLKLGDANETVVPTKFEDIPKTWMKLFEGSNTGKLVTKL